jgi:hypothetical protein
MMRLLERGLSPRGLKIAAWACDCVAGNLADFQLVEHLAEQLVGRRFLSARLQGAVEGYGF